MKTINFNRLLDEEELKQMKHLQELFKNIKEKIQLIQTYTDDERILAQCNLILKELDYEV